MVESQVCSKIMGLLKSHVRDTKNLPDTVNIMLLSRSGRHRSIAMSKISNYALGSQGFKVSSGHVHSCFWPDNLGVSCYRCGPKSASLKLPMRQGAIVAWSAS